MEGEKEEVSEVFDMEDLVLLYIKSPGVYNCDFCRRHLFQASVLKIGTKFWRKTTTWDTMLQMIDYSATADIAYGHPGWTNVMKDIKRVPDEGTPYWSEGMESRGKRAVRRPEQKNVT